MTSLLNLFFLNQVNGELVWEQVVCLHNGKRLINHGDKYKWEKKGKEHG